MSDHLHTAAIEGRWHYLRGMVLNMNRLPRTESNVRRWIAWRYIFEATESPIYRTIYEREVMDNDDIMSTDDEDLSVDYNAETSGQQEPTDSEEEWWDTEKELERVISYHACGNRPFTGPQRDILLIIKRYVKG